MDEQGYRAGPYRPVDLSLGAVAKWFGAGATASLLLFAACVVVADARAGLDLTDEGLYLLAADNHQPLAAYNGWWGTYSGQVFAAVGHDIALFRIAGLVLLLAAGALLGTSVISVLRAAGIPLQRPVAFTVVLGVAAGQMAFYGLYLRTPAYNWLALMGVLIASAGLLRQMAAPTRVNWTVVVATGLLVATGSFLATWAKAPAGLGLAGMAFLISITPTGANWHSRVAIGVASAAAFAMLLAGHVVAVADPANTASVLSRSLRYIAVVDPTYYVPLSALMRTTMEVVRAPWSAVLATFGVVLLSLTPLLVVRTQRWPRSAATGAFVLVSVGAVSIVLVARGQFAGGSDALTRLGPAFVAVLGCATVGGATSWLVARSDVGPSSRNVALLAVAALILACGAGLYAFGSNNGVVAQVYGAGGLLLAASVLFVVIGIPPSWAPRVLSGASIAIATLAVLMVGTARTALYRSTPPSTATVSIAFGVHATRLDLDPMAAGFWTAIQGAAQAAGWRYGDRLLDLSWSPAVPYALGASVPDTLVANLGRHQNAAAAEALSLSGGASGWRNAWVLVPVGAPDDFPGLDPAAVLAPTGRRFPTDYQLVTRLEVPWRGFEVELWRPSSR